MIQKEGVPPYQVLVLGCGNIGAMYDFETEEVFTHCKAFSLNRECRLSVSDVDILRGEKVAAKYGAKHIEDLNDEVVRQFDIVSVCVPTQDHLRVLMRLLSLKTPLIICEKPVVGNLADLQEIQMRKPFRTKIIVNYFRRFLPSFALLKMRLGRLLEQDDVVEVTVRYQRGLLNNGGHAWDLLSFLLDRSIEVLEFKISNHNFDAFPDDPTVTVRVLTNLDFSIQFVGIPATDSSIFEIDICTKRHLIEIRESGDEIRYRCTAENLSASSVNELYLCQRGALTDYMKHVVHCAIGCLNGETDSNFESALETNKEILKIIAPLVVNQ